MSSGKKKPTGEDLWSLVENEQTDNSDEADTTTLFVGK